MLWLPRYVMHKINFDWITLSLNSLLKWESNPCLFFLILFLQTHFVFFLNIKRVHRSHNRCHWILYEDVFPYVVICRFLLFALKSKKNIAKTQLSDSSLCFEFVFLERTTNNIIKENVGLHLDLSSLILDNHLKKSVTPWSIFGISRCGFEK